MTPTYRTGLLSTGSLNTYSDVVNFDIAPLPYTFNKAKARNTSFSYKKRKGYFDIMPSNWGMNYKDRDVTDVYIQREGNCQTKEMEYIYLYNKGTSSSKVITRKRGCDYVDNIYDLYGGDFTQSNINFECSCPCGYNKFFITEFVKGTPRLLGSSMRSTTGVQENTNNGTLGQFYDPSNVLFPNVRIGDWIYVDSTTGSVGSAFCGQARQVVGIKNNGSYDVLMLNAPRENIGEDLDISFQTSLNLLKQYKQELFNAVIGGDTANITKAQQKVDAQEKVYLIEKTYGGYSNTQKGVDASYSVYPERGEVPSLVICGGIKTIHSLHSARDISTGDIFENNVAHTTTTCSGFDSDVCIMGINEHQGKINLLGSTGFTLSGGVAYNKFNFSNNTNYIGGGKIAQTVFRNFLVQFGKRSISVVVYNAAGESFAYDVDSEIGLFSNNAYQVFQNSLYIVGSDKRLYACDISSKGEGAGYMLNLNDQSISIKGDLDMLQDGDEVNLNSDGKNIYIFINHKSSKLDNRNTKTKVLIYNKDYLRWVTHSICNFNVSGKVNEYFIGNSLYTKFGNKDKDIGTNSDTYYTAYIEGLIGEHEDGVNQKINLMSYKTPQRAKIILGKGIYTDESTSFTLDHGVGFKKQFQSNKVEHIEWIYNNNRIQQGLQVVIPPCIIDTLSDCTNIVRPCSDSLNKLGTTLNEHCVLDDTVYSDDCICIDDLGYSLTDTYSVYIDFPDLGESEFMKFRITSEGGDMMRFCGMVLSMIVDDLSKHNADNDDVMNIECCADGKYIDLSSCGC